MNTSPRFRHMGCPVRSRFHILPWPKSMASWLLIVITVALVLAQAAGWLVLSQERDEALQSLNYRAMSDRVMATVRLLQETPKENHRQVIHTVSSDIIRFSLDRHSNLPPGMRGMGSLFARRLEKRLYPTGVREVRATLMPASNWFWQNHNDRRTRFAWWQHNRSHGLDWSRDWDESENEYGQNHRLPIFAVAVRLPDKRWLNIQRRLPPQPFALARTDLLTLGLSLLVVGLVVIVMVRWVTRPVKALADGTDALGRGADVPPLKETGPEEVRRAVQAFNRMNTRLRRFVQDRMTILAALSHDLRTPITSLRLRAEFIEDTEIRTKILETVDEIAAMTESTLSFVREDAEREPLRPIDLCALVDSLCADLVELGMNIRYEVGNEDIVLSCRPVALRRALRNLVENAVKYGKQARVSLQSDKEKVLIHVEDDGPGVPEDRMEEMFKPFTRLERSRSRKTGGVGMGLAIARMIARSHGGDILLSNRPEGGLRALLSLPAG